MNDEIELPDTYIRGPNDPTTQRRRESGVIKPRAYQHRIVADDSRFILWLKSRQIGGSWGATLKVALHAAETGEDWVLMSRGERQAGRLLEKVAKHLKAYDMMRTKKFGLPSIIARINTERIDLTNGSAIMAMPCDDETTVGDSANVLIDEYGLFKNSEKIFEALTPCILNGYIILILSTPRGRKNKLAHLWLDKTNGWSKHKTTLYDAEREGLVIKDEKGRRITAKEFLEELHKKGMSMQAIRQEFLCEFIDEATAFLPEDMIRKITDKTLTTALDWQRIRKAKDLYVGMDIGRFNDLTAIWVWERTKKKAICRGVKILKNAPFKAQEDALNDIMREGGVRRVAIDGTGMGLQLAERMVEKWGEHKVERVTFTETSKAELATGLKMWVEKEDAAIPEDDDIINDWRMIEQETTESGRIKYGCERSSGSHADRFWAAALGLYAMGGTKSKDLVMSFAFNERDN